jgi:thioredoxin-related protein
VKKILLSLLIITLLSPFTVSAKVDVDPTTNTITSVAQPRADTTSIEIIDIKEKIQYNYYHSDTCGWCQKLDKFLKKHDGYQKLNINKIDARTRGDEMVKTAEEHGIDPMSVGTPFVTYGTNGT